MTSSTPSSGVSTPSSSCTSATTEYREKMFAAFSHDKLRRVVLREHYSKKTRLRYHFHTCNENNKTFRKSTSKVSKRDAGRRVSNYSKKSRLAWTESLDSMDLIWGSDSGAT